MLENPENKTINSPILSMYMNTILWSSIYLWRSLYAMLGKMDLRIDMSFFLPVAFSLLWTTNEAIMKFFLFCP